MSSSSDFAQYSEYFWKSFLWNTSSLVCRSVLLLFGVTYHACAKSIVSQGLLAFFKFRSVFFFWSLLSVLFFFFSNYLYFVPYYSSVPAIPVHNTVCVIYTSSLQDDIRMCCTTVLFSHGCILKFKIYVRQELCRMCRRWADSRRTRTWMRGFLVHFSRFIFLSGDVLLLELLPSNIWEQ